MQIRVCKACFLMKSITSSLIFSTYRNRLLLLDQFARSCYIICILDDVNSAVLSTTVVAEDTPLWRASAHLIVPCLLFIQTVQTEAIVQFVDQALWDYIIELAELKSANSMPTSALLFSKCWSDWLQWICRPQ